MPQTQGPRTSYGACSFPEVPGKQEDRKRHWLSVVQTPCKSFISRAIPASGDPGPRFWTLYHKFKFSNGWFQAFRKRWGISNRCRTKIAQKPPEDLREKIEQWLRFNRRQTVIEPCSIMGLPRGKDVPLVGRFKLSEIANMDQTPLACEFLNSKTYNCKGSKTVWLKKARSGWSMRQCTLQVCVYADGVQRCDPFSS